MKLYRCLTGPDDASFCRRVTEALNRGWQLHGSPTLAYDPQTARMICGQAIVKDVDGVAYTSEIDFSDY